MAEDVFDFIVVGSGAGGGPLAARLALESTEGYRIALLEAGVDPAAQPGSKTFYNTKIPALHANATEDPTMSWDFDVQHYDKPDRQNSKYDRKYNDADRGIFYPRCAALGGCTAHHAMITLFPFDADWSYLESVTHDPSWNPANMRKIFERLEDCRYIEALLQSTDNAGINLGTEEKEKLANSGGHGTKGWLPVSMSDPTLALQDSKVLLILTKALEEQTHMNVADILKDIQKFRRLFASLDPNGLREDSKREGSFNTPASILDGARYGVRERILTAQARYPNRLKIFTGAFVTRVLLDGDPLAAIGVEYVQGTGLYGATPSEARGSPTSQPRVLKLRKGGEVILSGGAFNTPQLLMLSGVGNATSLSALGIKPKRNLPGVGENLQDRYEMSLVTELTDPGAHYSLLDKLSFTTPSGDCAAPATGAVDVGFQQWCNHRGVYLTNGVLVSFIRKSKRATDGVPDLFIFGTPGNFRGYKKGWSNETQIDKDGENHRRFTWVVLKNGKTNGKGGYVRLRTNKAFDRPDINFMYFDNDGSGTEDWKKDRDAVAEGIQFARDKMKATKLNYRAVYPLDDAALDDPEKLGDIIVKESWGHHACGTCKIGDDKDEMAVLDGDFRVRGVENLRVVDASVFPKIPGLFIVSSIYMISEKAADVILADANLRRRQDPKNQPKPWPKAAPGLG